ncbi:unnamed protein product, partial [Amoebophrya sp. A25]
PLCISQSWVAHHPARLFVKEVVPGPVRLDRVTLNDLRHGLQGLSAAVLDRSGDHVKGSSRENVKRRLENARPKKDDQLKKARMVWKRRPFVSFTKNGYFGFIRMPAGVNKNKGIFYHGSKVQGDPERVMIPGQLVMANILAPADSRCSRDARNGLQATGIRLLTEAEKKALKDRQAEEKGAYWKQEDANRADRREGSRDADQLSAPGAGSSGNGQCGAPQQSGEENVTLNDHGGGRGRRGGGGPGTT